MEILEILFDGKWHTPKEIQQKTKLSGDQIQQVLEFLERYGFTSVDEVTNRVMLDRTTQEFLVQKSNS
jgi:DNA-binding IclR family transcriptional regulator